MSDQLKANSDIMAAGRAIPQEKIAEFNKCVAKNRKAIDEMPHLERAKFLDKIVAYVLRPEGTTGKMEYDAKAKGNPWAIATAKVGRKDPAKYERAVKDIKNTMPGYEASHDTKNGQFIEKPHGSYKIRGTKPTQNISYIKKGSNISEDLGNWHHTKVKGAIHQHSVGHDYDAKIVGKGDAMDRLAHEAAMFSAMASYAHDSHGVSNARNELDAHTSKYGMRPESDVTHPEYKIRQKLHSQLNSQVKKNK